jgi:hypothetical protein
MDDAETRHDGRGRGMFVVYILVILVFLYFGFFGLIVLDEGVFRTFWFSKTMNRFDPAANQSISQALRTIYAPLIFLFRQLGALR